MGGGEYEAELVGDVVTGEGTAESTFFEHEAIVHRGDGGRSRADVDNEGRGFACGKAGGNMSLVGMGLPRKFKLVLTPKERRYGQARRPEIPNSPWRFR